MHYQTRTTILAVAHRGDTEQAFHAGYLRKLHVSLAEHAGEEYVVARGLYTAALVLRHAGSIGVRVRNGVPRLPDVVVLIHRLGVFAILHQSVDEMFDLSRVSALCIRVELNARDRLLPIAHDRRDVYGGGCNFGACEQLGIGDDGGRRDKLRHTTCLGIAGRAKADIQRIRRVSAQC